MQFIRVHSFFFLQRDIIEGYITGRELILGTPNSEDFILVLITESEHSYSHQQLNPDKIATTTNLSLFEAKKLPLQRDLFSNKLYRSLDRLIMHCR